MRQGANRNKTTPRVKDGAVQKKQNWEQSTSYFYAPDRSAVVIDRQRPGVGYRHVLRTTDIYQFLDILPDWEHLAVGLNAIVLASGEEGTNGWHTPGVVAVCAWEEDLWHEYKPDTDFYDAHAPIFERLGVPSKPLKNGNIQWQFDENSVRAYQLLHILLHELGHHHDRITTRSQVSAARGEPYAEAYALEHEAKIWDDYWRVFER
jgi:hypothetical protein